jgi:hypothetical protein
MTYSAYLYLFKTNSINGSSQVELGAFTTDLSSPPTHPLNPVNPDNACTLRITAAAGTELAGAYSSGTVNSDRIGVFLPCIKEVYNPEGLHPPRGMAGSEFPPLSNIPYCCLP